MATRNMMMLAVLTMCLALGSGAMSNGLEDYGNWNYRDGAEHVNVASVRSVTRVLDAWGKRIFNEIKMLLHSQPNALLPDYSRVRPLSESLNDLFREVSHLQKRITDLNNRLATLEPFLRRHGYHEEEENGAEGTEVTPQSLKGVGTSLAQLPNLKRVHPGAKVVRIRKVRVNKNQKEDNRKLGR